jgi:putative transposase
MDSMHQRCSYHTSLRKECLNVHWFGSLAEAEQKIEAWRKENN